MTKSIAPPPPTFSRLSNHFSPVTINSCLAVLLIVALAIIEKLYRSERSHVAAEAQLKSQLAKANKRAHDLEPHLIAWNKTQSELDAQDVRGTDVIDQYKKNLAESRKEIRVGGTKNGQLRKKKPS